MQDDQLPLPPGFIIAPPRKIPTQAELSEICKKARIDGFLKISDLADILSHDDSYQILLPQLWDRFDLNKLREFSDDTSTPEKRFVIWFDLLDRLTTGTINAGRMKPILFFLPGYKTGPSGEFVKVEWRLGDPDYVKPEEIMEYFTGHLKIPLPVLLFPPDEESIEKAGKIIKLTPVQEDREGARDIANTYICGCEKKGAVPSIKEAVERVKDKLTGLMYKDKTIRKWINNLFPPESRKPGRPKKL